MCSHLPPKTEAAVPFQMSVHLYPNQQYHIPESRNLQMTMHVDCESLTYIYASAQHDLKSCDRVRHQPNPASQTTSRNVTAENPAVQCFPSESYTGHTETESKTRNIT